MYNFFTADTHFGHPEIISFDLRNFKSIEAHDECLIRNWNSRVSVNDRIFILGDFKWKRFNRINELNGEKILIVGNHDGKHNKSPSIIESIVIDIAGTQAWCVHNPAKARVEYKINLVAHVHNAWKHKWLSEDSLMINVGVDVWNLKPVRLDEVIGYANNVGCAL